MFSKGIEPKETTPTFQVVQWNVAPQTSAPGTPSPAWDPASDLLCQDDGMHPFPKHL